MVREFSRREGVKLEIEIRNYSDAPSMYSCYIFIDDLFISRVDKKYDNVQCLSKNIKRYGNNQLKYREGEKKLAGARRIA